MRWAARGSQCLRHRSVFFSVCSICIAPSCPMRARLCTFCRSLPGTQASRGESEPRVESAQGEKRAGIDSRNAWRGAQIITQQMNPVEQKVLAGPSGPGLETVSGTQAEAAAVCADLRGHNLACMAPPGSAAWTAGAAARCCPPPWQDHCLGLATVGGGSPGVRSH